MTPEDSEGLYFLGTMQPAAFSSAGLLVRTPGGAASPAAEVPLAELGCFSELVLRPSGVLEELLAQ